MPVFKNKHYLCAIAAVLVFSPTLYAADAEDAIAACARISSTGDRIICLENALRRLSQGEDVQVEETYAAELEQAVDTAADPEVKEQPVEAPVRDAEDEVVTEAAVPVPAASVDLGAEQVASRTGEEAEQVRISAKIVAHQLVGTGRLRVTLDNGQVWQQTGDDDDRIARKLRGADNVAVEMWQSRSGGYRMHLVDIDRTLRVRRIR